jgi:hypothetical protein
MKLSLAIFAACAASVAAFKRVPANGAIKADSNLGMKLLSVARNLEQDEEEADASEFQWVSGYSLKFQGCHNLQQWNSEADEDNDVKIATKRLVRFRLCPTSTCSASDASGCTGGYGDYVMDMNTYVAAYFEATQTDEENDEDEEEEFDAEKYTECAQLEGYDQDDGEDDGEDDEDRKLEDQDQDEDDADGLYVGPYCAEQGGAIYFGMFTDNTCTEFADDYGGKTTFKELTGQTLPYSSESIVGMECVSCLEQQNDNDDNNQGDDDAVGEECAAIYSGAGKCEVNLPSGMVDDPNNNACSYIDGIKIVRSDGLVFFTNSKKNPVATAFIVIFVMLFCSMGFYVWYLRKRIGVKQNALM